MEHLGYEVAANIGQAFIYRHRYNPNEPPVALSLPEGGLPVDDFRRTLVDGHGMLPEAVGAALEQL